MKNILLNLLSPELNNNVIFQPGDINNLNEPFIVLKEKLASLGYDIKTTDNHSLDNCAWVLFIDFPPQSKDKKNKTRNLYQECLTNDLENKMALFLWEGKPIKPQNYSSAVYGKFKYIFTWRDDLVDNKKFFKFHLPIPKRKIITKEIPFDQKKLLVNISANKFSSVKGEMFSARRQSVRFFQKNYPQNFDLYGPKWNKPNNAWQKIFPWLIEKFPNHRGISYDKITTLSGYKFSLCYENLASEPGFITEKIFDCLVAKTVPIYLGATNIENYIDPASFIDRRQFKTDQELADFITSINEKSYNKYLEAMDKCLAGEKYKLFLPENFANTIIKVLKLNT